MSHVEIESRRRHRLSRRPWTARHDDHDVDTTHATNPKLPWVTFQLPTAWSWSSCPDRRARRVGLLLVPPATTCIMKEIDTTITTWARRHTTDPDLHGSPFQHGRCAARTYRIYQRWRRYTWLERRAPDHPITTRERHRAEWLFRPNGLIVFVVSWSWCPSRRSSPGPPLQPASWERSI